MPTPPLPDAALLEAVEIRNRHKTLKAAAAEAGLSWSTFEGRLRRAAQRGLDGSVPAGTVPLGLKVKGLSTLTNLRTGEALLQWTKAGSDDEGLDEIVEALRDAFTRFDGKVTWSPPPQIHVDADLATIFPVADLHLGLLSWGRETGTDWDLAIAERMYKSAMGQLFSTSPAASTAVILGLGDLMHADNYENQTDKSKNSLDVEGRYPKVLRAAADIMLWTVERALERHDRVLVRVLPGNHDERSAIAISMALDMLYRMNPRVTVDASPSRFWWFEWGTSLLGATHGDKAKMAQLPLVMAAHNAEAWGRTTHRSIYTGHIHTQTGIEAGGVTVESFRTLAAPDAWHRSMGYGAGRSVTSITHCKQRGELTRQRASIV